MDQEYIPFLSQVLVEEPLMWVYDIDSATVIDATPATRRAISLTDSIGYPSSLSEEFQIEANLTVVTTGKPRIFTEWVKFGGKWQKLARSKSHAGGSRVLEVLFVVTHLDPRADWLARINLVDQRLELDNGGSISFAEFVVLNLLLKGYSHKRIARRLDISRKTVDYRIARLKNALDVDTTEELMISVSTTGLIHLATVPIDPENPALTELELYQRIPD